MTVTFNFKNWSEVSEKMKSERENIERKNPRAISRFHYHGFVALVNNEKYGDAYEWPRTKSSLMNVINETTSKFPDADIEIFLEAHWDLFETYADKLTSGGDYIPSEDYIDLLLYKKTV